MKFVIPLIVTIILLGCKSTKTIQTAISKKDTTTTILVPVPDKSKNDTMVMINNTLRRIAQNTIQFKTFSAKVNTDYKSGDGKSYNVNATVQDD